MTDILIVDDERDIRELISEILLDEGYQTRLCGSADGCLQELKKSVPGLLILDIWLKDNEMDGIDILVKAKRDYPQVPVVIIHVLLVPNSVHKPCGILMLDCRTMLPGVYPLISQRGGILVLLYTTS